MTQHTWALFYLAERHERSTGLVPNEERGPPRSRGTDPIRKPQGLLVGSELNVAVANEWQ